MIPDLGKYAATVLGAYGATLAVLAVLIIATVMRGRKVRAELEAVEQRIRGNG